MWSAVLLGIVALLALGGAAPSPAAPPPRPKLNVLAVDTNTSFGFLPPPTSAVSTNKPQAEVAAKPLRLKRLARDDGGAREQVRLTIGGKPGEKEADKEQRPNAARDLAIAEEREKILSTTPVLPEEMLQEPKKEERELWITAKPKDDAPPNAPGAQMPFDTWVLQPSREGPGATPPPGENLRERAPQPAQPAARFDFTPSPFDLATGTRAPAAPAPSRGILSSRPIEVPLYGGGRDGAAMPPRVAPPSVSPSAAPSPALAAKPAPPAVLPSVEFSRDSPFANRPTLATTPAARPSVAQPFPTESSKGPVKTRDELAAEKWEKYFDDKKRGF
jgi:hypothetical protein